MCALFMKTASCRGKWSRSRARSIDTSGEIKSHKTIKKVSHYARLADLCNCSCRDPHAVNKETRGVCNELHSCAWERVLSLKPPENTQLLTVHVEPEFILHSGTGHEQNRFLSENLHHRERPRVPSRPLSPRLLYHLQTRTKITSLEQESELQTRKNNLLENQDKISAMTRIFRTKMYLWGRTGT